MSATKSLFSLNFLRIENLLIWQINVIVEAYGGDHYVAKSPLSELHFPEVFFLVKLPLDAHGGHHYLYYGRLKIFFEKKSARQSSNVKRSDL